ncbi:putative thiol methyltransferase 2 [Escovopsis weberi]|uniref:Putative thiol methyltransferase 2 n=1 Tax=Escovopsis weberi TaxID=150374 RepID=A0A0M8N6E2_ESCWE|nr:putative thiol methyltransferase 2 [Escovopsis weberi]
MPFSSNPALWDGLYSESFTPWDRAGPSLALADLLAQRTDLIPPSQERDARGNPLRDASGKVIRRTALVPGCGPGHDVLLLSSLGYDAVGLDFSNNAIQRATDNERVANESGKYEPVEEGLEKGTVTWLTGDFFADEWTAVDGTTVSQSSFGKFDLIFDYTFLCALQLPLRPQWAKRMSRLLAPGGHLICLEYPVGKPISLQGPPWGLWPEVYEALLGAPGKDIRYNDDGTVASDSCPGAPHPEALHRICLVKPRRTHKAGTNEDGTVRDFISVWCR